MNLKTSMYGLLYEEAKNTRIIVRCILKVILFI